eukprot:4841971-Pyramimonas_sp.AAC.1
MAVAMTLVMMGYLLILLVERVLIARHCDMHHHHHHHHLSMVHLDKVTKADENLADFKPAAGVPELSLVQVRDAALC